jgi:L-threonylcarbamoyladenylate synthase
MARPTAEIVRIAWPEGSAAPSADADAALDRAAGVLRGGGLVAIPTETVYGLAANALDDEAVTAIYRAKGRPSGNPVIVHVADIASARSLSGAWSDMAERIAARLWPGPVTVVVPRGPRIGDVVTAGGPTVALRCPAHPLTRRLIDRCGLPLAAPSANRSEAVSPTTAAHVLAGLGDRIALILDAGPCTRGIESTVIDCTTSPPTILRPGPLSRASLEDVIGGPVSWAGVPVARGPARSPGQQPRHYAPRTRLELPDDPIAAVATHLEAGLRLGWLTARVDDPDVRRLAASRELMVVPMPADADAYAARLYSTLHALDQRGLDRIIVDPPPSTEGWAAVADRLRRAAS